MNTNNQRGVTLIGFLLLLAAAVFVAYIGMKLFPIYYQHYNISSTTKSIAEESGSAQYSEARIRDLLDRRLGVNYVRNFDRSNIQLVRSPSPQLVTEYEVRESILGNIDVVVSFSRVDVLSQ